MNASDRKTIQLYLMDGDVNGRIKCTIGSWTGVLYKIPRADLEKCKDRDHLKQKFISFLEQMKKLEKSLYILVRLVFARMEMVFYVACRSIKEIRKKIIGQKLWQLQQQMILLVLLK